MNISVTILEQEANADRGAAVSTPPDTILGKTARGAGWIIGWRMATRLLGLVNTLTLARLLVPGDFGLVALATGFAGSLDSLSSLGVEEAIIRLGSKDREIYDTGFTINLLRGILTAGLIIVLAGPAARFFHDPRLAFVLVALSLSAFFSGLMNIGTVEFRQDLAFDKEFVLLVIPRVISVGITLSLGIALRNYWALVAGILAAGFLRAGMSYFMHPYRPALSLRSWRKIAAFSAWTWLLGLGALIRSRSANLVIGRMLSVRAVGLYEVGLEIAWLPTSELIAPLGRACFPGFVALRDSGRVISESYLRITGAMALFTIPAGVGLSLIADPVVRLAFGSQWLSMIPVVEILALAGTMTVFRIVSSALFSAYGMLRSMTIIAAGTTAFNLIVTVVFAELWGIVGAAAGVGLASAVEQITYIALTSRWFGVTSRGLLRVTWRGSAATVAMAAVMYGTGLGWTPAIGDTAVLAIRLLESLSLGIVVYSVVLVLLWITSGRPPGSEADLWAFAARLLSRHVRRVWRSA